MAKKSDSGTRVVKTACYLCHGGCILLAHVKDGKLVKMEGDPEGPHNRGAICDKALSAVQYMYSPYRIKYPMKRVGERGEGKWKRISWDEALDTTAEKLQKIKDEHGPWAIAYAWGTGRVPREIPFIGFFSGSLGTPNGIGIGHVCLTKTRMPVMSITMGKVKGASGWGINRDFDQAACIVAWGESIVEARCDYMGTGWKRVSDSMQKGTKLIVIDPVYTRAAQKASIWLPVRPGTDIALALAWQNVIISENLYDKDFVANWTNAPFLWRSDTRRLLRQSDIIVAANPNNFVVWDTLSKSPRIWNSANVTYESQKVKPALTGSYNITLINGKIVECKTVWQLIIENTSEWTPEKASEVTWIPADKIRDSARMYATSKPACIEWGVAMSQTTRSTATNQAILQLEAITGNTDVRGGNPFWIIPGFRDISDAGKAFKQGLTPEQESHRITGGSPFSANPDLTPLPSAWQPGVWKAVLTGDPYPVRALFATDSNPLCSHGNPDKFILDALKKLEFIVWTDIVMNPSAEWADIILPTCTPFERDWLTPTCEVGIMAAPKVIEPLYESRSDFYIYRDLCVRWGRESVWPWKTEEEWCNWQIKDLGITFKELTKTCFYPTPEVWKKYDKGLLREDGKNGFATPSGKCELYASIVEKFGIETLPFFSMPLQSYETTPELAKKYPLILSTGARATSYPFFHSQYRHVPWLREMQPYPLILINPQTASELGIKNGDWAWVETPKGKARFNAEVTERISPKIVSVGHCWWYPELPAPEHGCFESNANLLVDPFGGADPNTGTTEMRGLLCKVYRADGPPPGVADREKGGN